MDQVIRTTSRERADVRPVLLDGNRDLHDTDLLVVAQQGHAAVLRAPAAAASPLLSVAKAKVPAFDAQRRSLDEHARDLAARLVVDLLNGRAPDLHVGGALLAREPLVVDEANRLVLVDRHGDDEVI